MARFGYRVCMVIYIIWNLPMFPIKLIGNWCERRMRNQPPHYALEA